ncbi:hypothetical protein Q3G72_033128 [Acer saccharum]|nr:hypothetical protein Q3G72_033128 [Acer saccharum]
MTPRSSSLSSSPPAVIVVVVVAFGRHHRRHQICSSSSLSDLLVDRCSSSSPDLLIDAHRHRHIFSSIRSSIDALVSILVVDRCTDARRRRHICGLLA